MPMVSGVRMLLGKWSLMAWFVVKEPLTYAARVSPDHHSLYGIVCSCLLLPASSIRAFLHHVFEVIFRLPPTLYLILYPALFWAAARLGNCTVQPRARALICPSIAGFAMPQGFECRCTVVAITPIWAVPGNQENTLNSLIYTWYYSREWLHKCKYFV